MAAVADIRDTVESRAATALATARTTVVRVRKAAKKTLKKVAKKAATAKAHTSKLRRTRWRPRKPARPGHRRAPRRPEPR